jgi:hypothetical protein
LGKHGGLLNVVALNQYPLKRQACQNYDLEAAVMLKLKPFGQD